MLGSNAYGVQQGNVPRIQIATWKMRPPPSTCPGPLVAWWWSWREGALM
jgi:hypothetical protein